MFSKCKRARFGNGGIVCQRRQKQPRQIWQRQQHLKLAAGTGIWFIFSRLEPTQRALPGQLVEPAAGTPPGIRHFLPDLSLQDLANPNCCRHRIEESTEPEILKSCFRENNRDWCAFPQLQPKVADRSAPRD